MAENNFKKYGRDNLYSSRNKHDEVVNKFKVECSCGWWNVVKNKYGRVVCKNCGKYVFRDKKDEFKYRLKNF